MKKNILLLLSSIFALYSYAKTPKIDAKINPYEYDERIAIGDHKPSLFNIANCKELYFAQDANYYYLATTFDATITMNWAFILSLNSLDGGMTDPRPRMVGYGHSARPNLMISGDFTSTKSRPYSAYTSIGSFWNPPSIITESEACSNITSSNTNGCLEISIPKSFVTSIKRFDVQFYLSSEITKNSTVFDAIPDDTEAPTETENTILYNYARALTALPIQLTDFKANLINDIVELQWDYKNPINFSHFELLRNNEVIGATKNTSFKDIAPLAENFYKLKMIDNDGTFTYSKIVSVKLKTDNTKVLQNPVSNVLKLQFNGIAKLQNISIYSSEGRKVYSIIYQHVGGATNINFSLPTLPTGVYRLLINNKSFSIYIQQ